MMWRWIGPVFFCYAMSGIWSTAVAKEVQFSTRLSSLIHLQTDRDFDDTASVFDPQGQWLGQAGSFA